MEPTIPTTVLWLVATVIYISGHLRRLPVNNVKERVAVARKLRDIVLEEGIKDDPETFCRNARNAVEKAMQQQVFEKAIDDFRPGAFIIGIFRAW
mmetsp:Transcript_890/g.1980  ORF Transcript_890/g.1980 Transcript_890/m.1980 type:complete len:95 (-) Transcript_890:296-580(-)